MNRSFHFVVCGQTGWVKTYQLCPWIFTERIGPPVMHRHWRNISFFCSCPQKWIEFNKNPEIISTKANERNQSGSVRPLGGGGGGGQWTPTQLACEERNSRLCIIYVGDLGCNKRNRAFLFCFGTQGGFADGEVKISTMRAVHSLSNAIRLQPPASQSHCPGERRPSLFFLFSLSQHWWDINLRKFVSLPVWTILASWRSSDAQKNKIAQLTLTFSMLLAIFRSHHVVKFSPWQTQ